jgi:hypothetical protein
LRDPGWTTLSPWFQWTWNSVRATGTGANERTDQLPINLRAERGIGPNSPARDPPERTQPPLPHRIPAWLELSGKPLDTGAW